MILKNTNNIINLFFSIALLIGGTYFIYTYVNLQKLKQDIKITSATIEANVTHFELDNKVVTENTVTAIQRINDENISVDINTTIGTHTIKL